VFYFLFLKRIIPWLQFAVVLAACGIFFHLHKCCCCIVICFIHFAACALRGFNLSADPFKRLAAEARDVCIQFLRAQGPLSRSRCNFRQTRTPCYNCVFLFSHTDALEVNFSFCLRAAAAASIRKKNPQARAASCEL